MYHLFAAYVDAYVHVLCRCFLYFLNFIFCQLANELVHNLVQNVLVLC